MTDTLQRSTLERGYVLDTHTIADSDGSAVFLVSLIGRIRRKEYRYADLAEAERQRERLQAALWRGAGVSSDGVVELDLLRFRHWLYTLPRGCVVGSYRTNTIHPLMLWCLSLSAKNYTFFGTHYAPCDVYKSAQRQYVFRPTRAPRLIPAEVQRYLERTVSRGLRRQVTREVAISDVEQTLAEIDRERGAFLSTTRLGKVVEEEVSGGSEITLVEPHRRGYDLAISGNTVTLIGKFRTSALTYSSEEEAREHYNRLQRVIRLGLGVPQDGVPLLDPAAFRRYLRTLPKGTVMRAGKTVHPVTEWFSVLTGKRYIFWRDPALHFWHATFRVPEPRPEEITPESLIYTMEPRPTPEPMLTLTSLLLRATRPLTREQTLEALRRAEYIVHDMHAMMHAFLHPGSGRRSTGDPDEEDDVED